MDWRGDLYSTDRMIYKTLTAVGVPIRMQGYRYMEAALRIMLQNEEAAYAITKMVYMTIAERYQSSPKQVESAIRTAVKSAWHNGSPETQEQIFGYSRITKKKPCNSEFLLRVLAYLRLMR